MPANWIGDGDITLSAPIEDTTTVDGPRSEIKQAPFFFLLPWGTTNGMKFKQPNSQHYHADPIPSFFN